MAGEGSPAATRGREDRSEVPGRRCAWHACKMHRRPLRSPPR